MKEISHNIIDRYLHKEITNKTCLKKNPMQLFQFFGTIKKIYLAEIVELTFLSQFFEDVQTLETLQNSLFIDANKIQSELSKIHHKDIIICFLYFNLSHKRLLGKNVGLTKRKVNPNLGKLFLRHFKHFSDDHNLKLLSDDEDYVPIKKKKIVKEGEITLNSLQNYTNLSTRKNISKKKDYTKNMKDVFVTHDDDDHHTNKIKEEDLKNKFDFPQINEDMTCDLPVKKDDENDPINMKKKGKKVRSNGWDNNEMYVYKKKDMSKKELNNLFPTLGIVNKKKKSNVSQNSAKSGGVRPGKAKNIMKKSNGFGNYQEDVLKKNIWDIPTNLANTTSSEIFVNFRNEFT